MKKLRVAVGLSGGVDSAVSAYLLKKQGFDISGIYLHCFDEDAPGCRGKQDRQDAVKVALHLKIPFQVLDFRRQYKAAVIDYFKKEYLAGRTPNPDVICNRDIKFGLFLDWSIKSGFDYVATGHYASLCRPEQNGRRSPGHPERAKPGTGRYPAERVEGSRLRRGGADFNIASLDSSTRRQLLARNDRVYYPEIYLVQPKDLHKDQTYFLWAVPRQNFSRVLFPLSDITKKGVRSVARLSKIPVAAKPDSTGICFIGEVRVEDFLKRLGVKEKIGEVITVAGRVIGRHRGVWFYTIGQRHGFETSYKQQATSNKSDRPPLYVIAKDIKHNRLVVGFGPETYRDRFEIADCNWLVPSVILSGATEGSGVEGSSVSDIYCRIRHLGSLIPCRITVNSEQLTDNSDSPFSIHCSLFTIHLRQPQRGVAPGQSAVFYSKDGIVLGGGVIQ